MEGWWNNRGGAKILMDRVRTLAKVSVNRVSICTNPHPDLLTSQALFYCKHLNKTLHRVPFCTYLVGQPSNGAISLTNGNRSIDTEQQCCYAQLFFLEGSLHRDVTKLCGPLPAVDVQQSASVWCIAALISVAAVYYLVALRKRWATCVETLEIEIGLPNCKHYGSAIWHPLAQRWHHGLCLNAYKLHGRNSFSLVSFILAGESWWFFSHFLPKGVCVNHRPPFKKFYTNNTRFPLFTIACL